jgi:translocation and assembly module TamA
VLNLQLGGASQALLSDRNFVRFYGRYQLFLPVMRRDVVILRAEGGITAPNPAMGCRRISCSAPAAPRPCGLCLPEPGREGRQRHRRRALPGGDERRVRPLVRGNWGVATFVDAGNANDERKLFKMNLGYGIGPRWKSPAGPIAVDLAYGQRDHRLRCSLRWPSRSEPRGRQRARAAARCRHATVFNGRCVRAALANFREV